MALILRIGSNEKSLSENETIKVVTLFNGQNSVDISISDSQNGEKIYYRVETNLEKKESDPFAQLVFQNIGNLQKLRVLNKEKEIRRITDIQKFFQDLFIESQSNPSGYWSILGLSEGYSDDDSLNKSVSVLRGIFFDQQQILGVVNDAVRNVREIRKKTGFIMITLGVSKCEVFINKKIKATLRKTLSLPEGEHEISITHNGREIKTHKVDVKAGEKKHVRVPINPAVITEYSGSGVISPVFILIIALMIGMFLWPDLSMEHGSVVLTTDSAVFLSVLLGVLLFGINYCKKWAIILTGMVYLYFMAKYYGQIGSFISLFVLIWLFRFYYTQGKNWNWRNQI